MTIGKWIRQKRTVPIEEMHNMPTKRGYETPRNACVARNREEYRAWLADHHDTECECYLKVHCGKPSDDSITYLDAMEEELCFGWKDRHSRSFPEAEIMHRFMNAKAKAPVPLRPSASWQEGWARSSRLAWSACIPPVAGSRRNLSVLESRRPPAP